MKFYAKIVFILEKSTILGQKVAHSTFFLHKVLHNPKNNYNFALAIKKRISFSNRKLHNLLQ